MSRADRPLAGVLLLFTLVLGVKPQQAAAAANFVYHEQSTRSALEDATFTDCSGAQPYAPILSPTNTDPYLLRFRVEFHLSTDHARVYYTTDGSDPAGSFGIGSNGTRVVVADYSCTAKDAGDITDICRASIPAQFSGTTVKYMVSAWLSGSDQEIFGNSGACIGCASFTNSAQATIFQYTVVGPPTIVAQPQARTNRLGTNTSFSVTAVGLPPLGYQWYLNTTNLLPGATNTSLAISNLQLTDAGTYRAVVGNSYGFTTSAVAILTLLIPPLITQQPASLTVTQGTAATFSVGAIGDAPLAYQWYAAGTPLPQGTNATLILTNVQSSQAVNYSVVITNNLGSATSLVASLIVRVPPSITQQPASLTVTQGASATFTALAAGDAPLSYQWLLGGAVVGQATNASLALNNVQGSDAGNYSVVASNAVGSVTSQLAGLTVRLRPFIVQAPTSLTATQGTTATLSVVAGGDPPLSYQWFLGAAKVNSATNATLSLSNVQASQAGNYSVVVSNSLGSTASGSATLTVLVPLFITAQPQGAIVVAGSSYTLSVSAGGSTPFSFQWRFNGSNLPGQTSPALPLSNIQTNHAGVYSVVVSNLAGIVVSSNALLAVHTTNDALYAAPNRGWAYLYNGNAAAPGVTDALDGTWNRQNGTDSWDGSGRGQNNGLPGGVGATNGILTLEDDVIVGTSSFDNRRFYLTHNLAQDLAVTNATTLLNDGVTLTFRARLTPPAPLDPLTELSTAPNGFVNISDGKGMFGIRQAGSSGMIISFSLNQAVEDLSTNTTFNFGQAGLHMNSLNGNVRSPNVDPGEGGLLNLLPLDPTVFHEFWITIQDHGAAAGTHLVTIYVDGSETPNLLSVTAGTGSDGPASLIGTNYLALGLPSTPQRGAVDVDFFGYKPGVVPPARYDDPLTIALQPADQVMPAGMVASFSVGVLGAPPYFFQWYRNGLAIDQATNTAYNSPPITGVDEGATFTVVVANLFQSVTSSPPARLHILPPPVILAQPQSLTVTNGNPASFSINAQSEVAVSYRWQFLPPGISGIAADLPGQTSSTLVITSAQPSDAGGYSVIVSNYAGSVTSTLAALMVNAFDFGDAPAPYSTLLSNNGARHLIVPGVHLGPSSVVVVSETNSFGITLLRRVEAGVDAEFDGQPDPTAAGDDLAGADDEDGVTFLTPLFAGRVANVQVIASTNGYLDAWIDFAGNGSWADAGDRVFNRQNLAAGTNLLTFNVPAGATATATFARFRFSTFGGLSFDGPAADGEVEDYAVTVIPVTDLAVSNMATPNPVAVNSNLVYVITVANLGPSTATGVNVTNVLPANIAFISIASSQGNCAGADGNFTCALGSLGANNSATVTITVAPVAVGLLPDTASVGGNEIDLDLSNNTAASLAAAEVPPNIATQPASLTVTQGNNFSFSVVATGTTPLLYQWQLNGLPLAGRTNTTLAITNVQPGDAGVYLVRIRNRVGDILSAPATLTVLFPPAITRQPQTQTNLAGSQGVLTVAAIGTTPLSYQWQFNGTPLTDATNATLTLPNVQKSQTGSYTVVVSNSLASVTSQPATLTVLEMDFGDAPDPAYPTLLAHNGARHRIVPGFYLGTSVDFEPDGQPNSTATGDDVNPAGPGDEDGVTFTIPLFAGQLASVMVVASSNGLLNAWIDFNRNGSWADAGDQIFTNQPLAAGSNLLSFRVSAVVATTNSYARFRFSSQGNLSFTGEAMDGEVEDYAIGLNAAVDLALGTLAQPNPVSVGSNLTYTISLTNNGPSTATGVTITDLLPPGASFVSATSSRGLCSNSGGTVTCSIGNLAAREFSTLRIVCTPIAAGSLANTASVTAVEHELAPLNNTSSSQVAALDYPVIIGAPQNLTVTNGGGGSFTVLATGTALTYQWRFLPLGQAGNGFDIDGQTNFTLFVSNAKPVSAGSYTVRVSNGVGAVLTAPAFLTVLLPPQITSQPQGQSMLAGGAVTFSVAASGSAPLAYQWRLNGTGLIGQTKQTLIVTNVQSAQAGAYTVQVSNGAGSVLSDTAMLVVIIPAAIAQQPQSRTDNAGAQSLLAVGAVGTEPLSYQWYSLGPIQPTATNFGGKFVLASSPGVGRGTVALAAADVNGDGKVDLISADYTANTLTVLTNDGLGRFFLAATTPVGSGPFAVIALDVNGDGKVDLISANSTASTLTVLTNDGRNGFAPASSPAVASQPTSVSAADVNRDGLPDLITANFGDNTLTVLTNDGRAGFFTASTPDLENSAHAVVAADVNGDGKMDLVSAQFNDNRLKVLTNDGSGGFVLASTPHVGLSPYALAAADLNGDGKVDLISANSGDHTLSVLTNDGRGGFVLASSPGVGNNPFSVAAADVNADGKPDLITANQADNTLSVLTNDGHGGFERAATLATGRSPYAVAAADVDGDAHSDLICANLLDNALSVFFNTPILQTNTSLPRAPIHGSLISGGTNSALLFPNVQKARSGDYYVVVSNAVGAVTSVVATLTILEMDFGDAPDGLGYPTTLLFNGARHQIVPGVHLGSAVDFEPDGQPSDHADGDDLSGIDDDDGVVFTSPLVVSQMATLDVTASASGFLDAWLDCNRNGNWADTGEQIFNSQPLSAGVNHLAFMVSARSVASNTFARFRFSTAGHLSYDGPAPDGEVEDYEVTIMPAVDLAISMAIAPEPVVAGSNLTCTITVANRGPSTANNVTVVDQLPAGLSFVSASGGTFNSQLSTLNSQLGSLASGTQAVVRLVVTALRPGLLTNAASVTAQELELNPADNTAAATSTVIAAPVSFANTSRIDVPDATTNEPSPASLYPSTILVSGLTATVFKVTVTLSNLYHTYPADFDIMLAGPNGQTVILMSDAGTVPIDSSGLVTLTFDDDSPLVLPETGRLVTERFKPTNYAVPPADPDFFPPPAPPPPHGAGLSVFAGTDPNGLWSLYVVDDAPSDVGSIFSGWSLAISTLNSIADLAVGNFPAPNPVALGSNLTYTILVTNQGPAGANGVTITDLLPPGLSFVSASGGTFNSQLSTLNFQLADSLPPGGIATVTLTVAPTLLGVIPNTVVVSGNEVDLNFSNNLTTAIVTVKPVTDLALSLTSTPDPIQVHQSLAYTLTVTNRGPGPATGVRITDLLPDGFHLVSSVASQGGCTASGGILLCDLGTLAIGAGASVALIGTADYSGFATNLATVSSAEIDSNFADNTAVQISHVVVAAAPIPSPGSVSIAILGAASPYPSTLQVSGLTAAVFQVTVTLSNLSHPFPADLDILLVGPDGQETLLMSDAGGGFPITGTTLTFDDNASLALPGNGQIVSGTFRPTEFDSLSDSFPAPAPSGPYPTGLAVFQGTDPNGVWQLFVMTDQSHASGLLAGGWSLNFATLNPISDLAVGQSESPNPGMPGSNLTYTFSITNLGPATAHGVIITDLVPDGVTFKAEGSMLKAEGGNTELPPSAFSLQPSALTIALGDMAVGNRVTVTVVATPTVVELVTNTVWVTSQEADLIGSNNLAIVITQVGATPSILSSPQSQMRTNHDSVTFSVAAGGGNPLSYQWLHDGVGRSASSAEPLLGATNASLVLNDLSIADAGLYWVRVSNPVGAVLSDPVGLEVLSRPTVDAIPDQLTDEDTVLVIPFVVADVETPADSLALAVSSSNPSLTPPGALIFGGGGSNRTLSIRPAANLSGSANISVTVTDADGVTAMRSFLLTVNPVNDAPTLDPIRDMTINGNAGPQTIILTGISSGAPNEPDTLSVSATSSQPSIIPHPTIQYGSPNGFAVLRLAPPVNSNGLSVVTVTVDDGQSSNHIVTRSFTVTVAKVNPVPFIGALADQTVNENASTGLIPVTIGDAETPATSLALTGKSSNPALVSDSNIIFGGSGSNRTVNVVPSSNQVGTAAITLTVTDGAGSSASATWVLTVNFVNAPPRLGAIADLSINENDGIQTVALSGIDAGAPGEQQILIVSATSSDPSIIPDPVVQYQTPGAVGTLRLAPLPSASGLVTITVTVDDGQAANNTAIRTFKVTVNPVNDPPTLDAIADLTLDEDAGLQTIGLHGISSGASNENQVLVVTAVSSNSGLIPNPVVAYASANSTGSLAFASVTNGNGSSTITVTVNDGANSNNLVSRSFNVTVNPVNDAPIISAIPNQTVLEDTSSSAIPFLVNDVDSPLGSLNLRGASSNPAVIDPRTIVFGGSGSNRTVTVTPVANSSGTALVTVTVSDGQAGASTGFVVTVLATNDPPTISGFSNQTINEGSSVSLPFTVADLETSAGSLAVTGFSTNAALVPAANIVFSGSGPDRSVTITPASNQVGTATIVIGVTDGSATTSVNFSLTVLPVNFPPVISTIPNLVINEGAPSGAIPFTVSDVETPAASLLVTAKSSNQALAPDAGLVLGGSGVNRTVTVTPVTNQFGAATITVTVADTNGNRAASSFLLTVNPVNHPPTISALPNQTVGEDNSISVAFTVGDVETPAYALTVTANSSNPALVPVANILPDGSGNNRMVIISPASNQNGTASITLVVSDGAASASNSFTLTVTATNDLPTLDPIPNMYLNVSPGTMTVNLTGITSGASNETQTLTITVVSNSNTGLFSSGPNVSYSSPDTTGSISFRPGSGSTGAATLGVRVSDGVANFNRSFTINVRASGNVPPSVIGIANQTINEDSSTGALPLTIGDTQTPANLLTVTAFSSNPALLPNTNIVFGGSGSNRTVTLTPLPNQFGAATVTISVADTNLGGTNTTFVLTVNPLNDAPAISAFADQTINEDTPTGVIPFTIGDGETPAASLTVTASSTNLTLVPNASIVFGGSGTNRVLVITPATNQFGLTLITVTVSDGSSNSSASFVLTVNPVSDPPSISAIPNQSVNEDTPTLAISFNVSDGETAAAALTLNGASSNPALVSNTNIIFGGSGSNRTVIVTPLPDQFGTSTVTITVSDGVDTASAAFLLTVTSVNDPPTLDPINDLTINQGAGSQTVNLTGITAGPTNEPQAVAMSAISSNAGLIPNPAVSYNSPNGTGSLNFTPVPGASGVSTVSVTMNDGQSLNNLFVRAFTVTVNPIPVISDIGPQITIEDTPAASIPFTVGDAFTPAASLILSADTSNPALIQAITFGGSGANRTLTVTPAPDQSGVVTVTVAVANTNGNTASNSFVLTVMPVNDPPTLDAISDLTLNEDAGPQIVPLTGITTGASNELQTLVVTAMSSAPSIIPHPTIQYTSPNSTGTLSFTSLPDANGTALITVTVNDGQNTNKLASRTFSVKVNAVNDPPAISSLADQATAQNNPVGPIPFTVGDLDNVAASLVVSGSSSNQTLVPSGNITFGGSGSNRTVTILPASNQVGTAAVTLTVSDGSASTSSSFILTVKAANTPPIISAVADQVINEGASTGPIPITLSDAESPPANLLLSGEWRVQNAELNSSPPTLQCAFVFGGSGANRTVTVTPSPGEFGTGVARLLVTDTNGASASVSFNLTVNPANRPPTLEAISDLTIPEAEPGASSAQLIVLRGITSGARNEAQVLSVTASNSNPAVISNLNISYLSPDNSGVLTFSTVPEATGSALITVFVNDGASSNNLVSQSFTVTVVPVNEPPILSIIPDQVTQEDTAAGPIAFTVGDEETSNLVVTATSSNETLLPAAGVILGGNGVTRTLILLPATNQSGSAAVSVIVSDGAASVATTFVLRVRPVNDPPSMDAPRDVVVVQDAPAQTMQLTGISAGPPDEQQRLAITAVSSDPSMIPHPTIQYVSPGSTGSLTFQPVPNRTGTALITLTLRDDGGTINGGQDTAKFVFQITVTPPAPPALQITRLGNTNRLSILTLPGHSYRLEYKDSLSDAGWQPLTTLPGTGAAEEVFDVPGPASSRFYRVRIE